MFSATFAYVKPHFLNLNNNVTIPTKLMADKVCLEPIYLFSFVVYILVLVNNDNHSRTYLVISMQS